MRKSGVPRESNVPEQARLCWPVNIAMWSIAGGSFLVLSHSFPLFLFPLCRFQAYSLAA